MWLVHRVSNARSDLFGLVSFSDCHPEPDDDGSFYAFSPNGSSVFSTFLPSHRSILIASLRTQSACDPCPSGTYTDSQHDVCNTCNAGYECLDRTLGQVLCADGYYSTGGTSACTLCPAGHFCISPIGLPQQCGLGTHSTR